MATKKDFVCPFCGLKYTHKGKRAAKLALYNHMEDEHSEDLCGLPPAQVYFNWNNKYALTKGYGKSILSGRPTKFNLTTERYERICPDEVEKYREMFLARMRKTYGKDTLLNDPEVQKSMLARRKISGQYVFANGEKRTYTGSYEKDFLRHLDEDLEWDPSDIIAPAPQLFPYEKDGKQHFHIPDFFISSLSLLVNVKSSTNQHYRMRDIETEQIEDSLIKSSDYNYIKIMEKDYSEFDAFIKKIQSS